MAARQAATVRLDQCLFGYDEGHRLLAGSVRLPDQAASLLLLLSDLVPGLPSGSFKDYWTGLPIPALKAYALMHTWPAPEMPRPGCVWTHVLLIGFADIAGFPNLADLSELFVKPAYAGDYAAYKEPLFTIPAEQETSHTFIASSREGLQVLRALYDDQKGLLDPGADDFDPVIFAAWSQQWPRLRRSFAFRTARGVSELPSSRIRFDLRLGREPTSRNTGEEVRSEDATAPWEVAALEDLLQGPTDFRPFLWRYGSDQRRGRERFRFLAEVFASTRVPRLSGLSLRDTLEKVVATLPDLADGHLLKQDLVTVDQRVPSLLPETEPLDILEFYVSGSDDGRLPALKAELIAAASTAWRDQPERILSIAEVATSRGSAIAEPTIRGIAALADSESFLRLSHRFPLVRERVTRVNPSLLDTPDIAGVEQPMLNAMLGSIREPGLADCVVKHLFGHEEAAAAEFLTERFPHVVEHHAYEAMFHWVEGSGPSPPRSWVDALRAQHSEDLGHRLVERVTTSTGLAACVLLLDLKVRVGLSVGPATWAEILVRCPDDVKGPPRQMLSAYLLTLALLSPVSGSEPLLEWSFESVHSDLWSSRLPEKSFSELLPALPDLSWWDNWDTCLRLRVATVNAYLSGSLDPRSFGRLTRDRALLRRLIGIAEDTKRGRQFLKGVVA